MTLVDLRPAVRPVSSGSLSPAPSATAPAAAAVTKTVLDRVFATLALVLALPLLALLALLVRASSPGPALLRQQRIGLGGAPFRMWKLRTMHVGEAADGAAPPPEQLHTANVYGPDGVLFKARRDPRVTPLGRLLRRYSLDELPQLLNVVQGHMSLVGPRPPLPHEVARYAPHVHRRLHVRPGMTGLWQVSGRSDLAWDDAVRLDLQYVDTWSLRLDLALLGRTVKAVLRPTGAY